MKRTILSNEQRNEIIEKYKSGRLIISLANEYKICRGVVRRLLNAAHVVKHNHAYTHRVYLLDESKFKEPLSQEALYWIGFLLADGNLYNRRNHEFVIQIGLAKIDVNHLEKFKSFLGTDKPIQHYMSNKSYPAAKVSINSKPIFENLQSLGLQPRKSFDANIREDIAQSLDFWRGVIDGDGSYQSHYNGTSISVILSKSMSLHFVKFIKNKYGYDVRTTPHILSPRMIMCHIQSLTIIHRFIKDMFYEGCVCLDRKQKLTNELLLKQYKEKDVMGRSCKKRNARLRKV